MNDECHFFLRQLVHIAQVSLMLQCRVTVGVSFRPAGLFLSITAALEEKQRNVWNVNAGLLERKASDLRASRQQTPRMLSFYFGRNFVWRDNLSSEKKGTGELPRSILVTFKITKEGDCCQNQRRASLAHLKPTRLLRSLWRDRACSNKHLRQGMSPLIPKV